ncbi:replication initiation protein [Psychrobacter sp. FME13]|uniref:replication initiation protein RepM n=1 Tax=Psychrobacter sp. FME13 TaxID=2487708 RepID=UPI0017887AA8|nr:replication initiation protein RepM [Psychrobacter sp. FME13]MBE0443433.1 replication initiation protein [Psychrobacter sp. FME13]
MIKKGVGMELVVKSNRLNTAIQNLSLSEIRLIQLAIIDSREQNKGLSANVPLRINASRYINAFDTTKQTAYEVLLDAETNLFERRFSFLDDKDNKVKSRWISQVTYFEGEGAIEIIFTPAVVNEITRIDGVEQFFTKYTLEQTAPLGSVYSVRLYELLIQWREAKKTPLFDLETFRGQLGIGLKEYKRMSDFKRRVLDMAIKEINDKTDLNISYEQEKNGKEIIGFKFKVLEKKKFKRANLKDVRDVNTSDMFTIEGLSDKQLGRIVRNPAFMAEYNHLVSPTSPAGQSMQGWEFEMINRLRKDASQFNKRPIRDYLEY